VDGRPRAREYLLEVRAPSGQRRAPQVEVAEREEIPEDHGGPRLDRQLADPGRGGVDAQQHRVEVEPARADDDDLAIEHAPLGQVAAQRTLQLREVPAEGLAVTGDLSPRPERNVRGAEPAVHEARHLHAAPGRR
jgi:hypothetical protein